MRKRKKNRLVTSWWRHKQIKDWHDLQIVSKSLTETPRSWHVCLNNNKFHENKFWCHVTAETSWWRHNNFQFLQIVAFCIGANLFEFASSQTTLEKKRLTKISAYFFTHPRSFLRCKILSLLTASKGYKRKIVIFNLKNLRTKVSKTV